MRLIKSGTHEYHVDDKGKMILPEPTPRPTIGSFTLIKNERPWIAAHIETWLPYLDEMVFFDGDSTDHTTEIIKNFKTNHELGRKIRLFEGRDPKNLEQDYVDTFDRCLRSLSTDWALFIHPDMLLDDPGILAEKERLDGISYFSHMRSFAGEPDGQLYEITKGRDKAWKNIYRLGGPDMGAHYHGFYGAANEDVYFSKITGKEHKFYGAAFERYPYEVKDSGIKISHFSDVRHLSRRVDRMVKCLINQGHDTMTAQHIAAKHPRVTFENGMGFEFVKCEYPEVLKVAANV